MTPVSSPAPLAPPRPAAVPLGAARLAFALFLVALNLRPAIASVPPLLRVVQHDLGLSSTAAGLLTTAPVLCMALLAPGAPRLARRWGAERTMALALLVLGAGTLARAVGETRGTLFGATLLAGVGIAVAGALLPQMVKGYFPGRAGVVTGVYTMGLCAGAAAGASLSVPLEHLLGGSWSLALGAWGLLAGAGLLAWRPVLGTPRTTAGTAGSRSMPWHSQTAWLVALYMGLQSLMFYSTLSWLAPVYEDRGWSPGRAGLLLGLFSLVQIFSSLALPVLADLRGGSRAPWIALSVGANTVGLLAVAVAPGKAPGLTAAVLGFGAGAAFALALVLIVDSAPDSAAAGSLSGMTFLVGYLLASVGPAIVGALHDLTHGFTVPFLFLVCVGALALGAGLAAARGSERDHGVRALRRRRERT